MFNKAGNGRGKGPETAALNGRVASLLTDDLTIAGDISGDGEMHVDCLIRGDVSVARLCVGETGRIEGAITAEVVELRGRVIGSITAKQVRLYASAHVEGDLTHEQLSIEPGAFFSGRSLRFQPPKPTLVEMARIEG